MSLPMSFVPKTQSSTRSASSSVDGPVPSSVPAWLSQTAQANVLQPLPFVEASRNTLNFAHLLEENLSYLDSFSAVIHEARHDQNSSMLKDPDRRTCILIQFWRFWESGPASPSKASVRVERLPSQDPFCGSSPARKASPGALWFRIAEGPKACLDPSTAKTHWKKEKAD
ncbi:hypothetical protein E2320_004966 [Naja naja]|nr:hypothetical protein E2320_004966 [Naja naja]